MSKERRKDQIRFVKELRLGGRKEERKGGRKEATKERRNFGRKKNWQKEKNKLTDKVTKNKGIFYLQYSDKVWYDPLEMF